MAVLRRGSSRGVKQITVMLTTHKASHLEVVVVVVVVFVVRVFFVHDKLAILNMP